MDFASLEMSAWKRKCFSYFFPCSWQVRQAVGTKKGERRCEQRREAEGPFEQALTFAFPSGGSLWCRCQPLLL